MRAAFYTLGCKVNQYDSDAMREQFERAGYETVEFGDIADVYAIATCTVTETADKKSRQMLSRAKRKNPKALIIATGCYAQRQAEKLLSLGVDLVVGNTDRSRIVELAEKAMTERGLNAVRDIKKEKTFEDLYAVSFDGRSRAQLKIQEGCNNFCSYCIIPYVRGPIRSMALDRIRVAAKNSADKGDKEIVLTGINLTAYGRDLGENIDLCDAIEACDDTRIKRVRLGSIDAPVLNREFVQRLSRMDRLCPHFHISLQSGSDTVLKRMRRKYTAEEYLATVNRIREVFEDAAITTDVIVGFPGETDEEFNETLSFCKKVGFQKIHVFPYSRREGTPAAEMAGQVPTKVKTERAAALQQLSDLMASEGARQYVGRIGEVLIEKCDGETVTGYTANYIQVSVADKTLRSGELVSVRFTDEENGILKAQMI